MSIVEAGPKSRELRDAEHVVSLWLVGLWVDHPAWLTRMPDREDIDSLVNAIAAELEKYSVEKRGDV